MSLHRNPKTAHRLHLPINNVALLVLLTTCLLGGCSDPDESEGAIQGDSTESEEGEGSLPGSVDEWTAFPADADSDDRQGLIVTGLDGLSAADVVSPWLAVTRTFRSTSATSPSPDSASEPASLQSGSVAVELALYADDFPISAHLQYLDIPLDSCVVHQAGSVNDREADNRPPPSISGGQSIVINTPSGPWYSIRASLSGDGQILYEAEKQLPGKLPPDTSLSIPGSAFPTVSGYPLYEPQPVKRLLPGGEQTVTDETPLKWVSGQQNTLVKIDWLAFDDADNFQGFPVSCHVIDDGGFEPSVEIRAALARVTDRLAVRYSRVYSRLDVRNGIVFYQEMEVAE